MALAGLNHKLAGNNLSAHDIPGILICSIYVGVRFPAHDSIIFRNGLVASSAPPANQTLAAVSRVRALPRAAHLGLLFFWRSAPDFDPAAHCTGDGVALYGNIFTARRQNS